jgi:hypothetical protein
VREIEWLTPLPWAEPPFEVVQRIYRESRANVATQRRGLGRRCYTDADTMAKGPALRIVSAEFMRRMVSAGIMVEGVTW